METKTTAEYIESISGGRSSSSQSQMMMSGSLVHSRLQQLMFEWLLLPQTAALARQLLEDDNYLEFHTIEACKVQLFYVSIESYSHVYPLH